MRSNLRPFIDETFSSESIGQSGLFSVLAIQAFWKSFLAGGDNREWSRVWSLAVLISFVNRKRSL
jgi:asparagine synthase (glutamine-hydrolysing)